MNLLQCDTLKECYCELRLAKDKYNYMHNACNEGNNRGQQGTNHKGQTGQEDLDKFTRRGQRQGSKDSGIKYSGHTTHLRNIEIHKEERKE